MRNKLLLLLLLLLLPAWVAWAQAPVWQSVSGITGTATTVRGSALAANGDYYIVGSYTGSADFGNGKSLTSSDQSTTDGFLARISGTTNLCTWVVSMGGTTGGDEVRGVAVNGSTVYITGYYNSSANFSNTSNAGSQPLTAVVNPSTGTGSVDVFVAKYDENGNPLGSISGGGTSSDQGFSIAVNGTNIYITGFISTSTTTPTNVKFGTVTLGNNGGQDMFVARFTDNGTLAHGGAQSGGGTGLDRGNAIGVGTNGIYVAGYFTAATNATASISNSTLTGAGSNDIYVAKFTDTGSGLNNGGAVRSGGAFSDQATALTVSGTNIYVGGFFNQNTTASGSVTISGTPLTSDNRDLFLAKYTDSGSGLSSGYAIRDGGANSDNVGDLAVSGSTVYAVGGYTTATTIAGSNLTSNGDDAYVAKYTDTGTTFSAIGAIDGGASAGGAASTGVSTVSVSGNQVVLGGFLGSPATFAPASTGTITVPANNSGFFAKLAQAPVLTSISPNTGPAGTSVTLTGTNLTGATVVTFSGTSNNTVASVTVNGTGTQTITVNVPTGATTGNVTVTTPAGTSNGVVFTVQQPTTIASIVPTGANPTNTTSVTFTVTFAANVTGVATTNFATVNGGGVTGSSVTSISGSGTTYSVVVNTGSGSGTVGLNMTNDTGVTPSISNDPFTGQTVTIDKTAPTVAITSSTAASGGNTSTSPIAYTVTFSEGVTGFVAGDVTVGNGTIAGFAGSGATYTFNVTPSANGAVTVNIPANVAVDQANNGNTAASQYSITYAAPNATVVSITRLGLSPTATTQVAYRVVFSGTVTGLTVSNFSITQTGVTGASISSVVGSGASYTVTANTGTGDGTLRVNLANSTGILPTVTNVPYTAGEVYTITKTFSNPVLTIQGTGGTGSDVTAFVDAIQVLSNGTAVANALQNGSFEQHNPLANGDFGYQPTGASWAFNTRAGIAESGSDFSPTTPIPNGIAVAFIQSDGAGANGQIQQGLTVPTGSYQVNFQASQRICCTTLDQSLNVFINGVFVGTIQPGANNYQAFTSATFNVTAPALTASISSTAGASGSTTATSPLPFTVTFSQNATGFTASDLVVTGGTVSGFTGSGTTYAFNVTPSASGAVTVNVPANSAFDGNNTGNTASGTYTLNTVTLAIVTTASPSGTTSNRAILGGSVTADGGDAITERGVVYSSTNQTPTTANTKDTNGTGTGSFSETITGFAPATTYYVRAYAINSAGTSYGAAVSFTTLAAVSGTTVVTNVSCFSGSNGTINLTPTGGVAPYTFLWNNGATTEDRTGLAAGAYSVTITDATGATGVVNNIIVTQPSAIGASTVQTNIACNGGTTGAASVSPAGGRAPYTYRWSTGATTQGISGLAAGSYSVTITDANGCTLTRNFTITQPPALTATTSQTDVTTNGGNNGSATITVSGGTPDYTYSWSPNVSTTATASNLRAGTYAVTATDAYGCTITRSFTINQPAVPTIVVAPATLPNATVASAYSQTLTASGGTAPYRFTITAGALPLGLSLASGGVISGTPTTSGTFNFTVTATDAANFTGTRSYTVVIGSQPVTATPVITSPANNSFTNQPSITISGTAPTGSAVTVYVSQNGGAFQDVGTYTATAGGTFTPTFPFPGATYQAYAVAQSPGAAASANSNLVTFTVDQTSPTVAITSTAGTNGSSTTTTPIPYTVTFSESVTGFVAGDVTVSNGTISGFTGSGTSYAFNVTPTTAGTATTVNVPANVAVDQAGNGNSAATQLSLTYQQLVTAAPVVIAPANGSTLNTATPTYTGTAPANSTVTVYVDNTAIGTTTATGGTFSLTQPTTLADGNHNVRATAQLSGNTVSANSNTNTFTVDTTAPTVVLGSTATNPTATSPIPVTVTFSEGVTGFGASSVTVSNGTVTGFSGSGSLYTFSVTPLAAGTVTVNIAANVAQDAAGNGNVAAPQFSITYVVPVTATTWTGAVSTDWFTAGNWTAGVPTATVDATIPANAPRYPVLVANAATKNLSLNSGATLTQTSGTLTLTANLTNNGTYTAPTSGNSSNDPTVSLGTTQLASILGSSNTRFCNLAIGTNGAQSSTSASTSVQRVLTLNGGFATNGNPLTLESNNANTAMLVNNGSNVVSGNVTVQRYISPALNASLGYRHFSSPISTGTVASLTTARFTPVVNPAYNTLAVPGQARPFPTVFGYDQSRIATVTNSLPSFDKGWFSPSALSDALTVGQGYAVNLAADQTFGLTGSQNNGNVVLNLARNSGPTAAESGLALVGNPYPSPLDWQQVAAADRPGLDGVIFVFASNDPASPYTGTYSFFNNGIGNVSPVLPLGQGFFVRVSPGQTSATLTFKNSHRPTSYANGSYRRTAADTRPLVHLTLKGAGNTLNDDAFVYFEQGSTESFDPQYDAVKLPNPNGLNLSTSVAGQQFSIDGRPELGSAQRVIPLAVGVPAPGSYTLASAELLNLTATPVYLRDLQLGTITDLRLTPSYQFTVTNSSALITNRFELVFSPQKALATVPAALAQQVSLYPNPAKKAAFVELPASLGRQAVTATLVDALGRQVRTVQLPAQGSVAHPLDLSELATGVYALRLSTSAGVVVKKLVIE